MKEKIFTTSWDDGNALDLKLLKLLDKYKIRGTFYVPKSYEKRSLSNDEVKLISKEQEIGAHTISHADLTGASKEEMNKEIFESKKYLEEISGEEIRMFCYPKGKYDAQAKELVKEAGFVGARTTKNIGLEFIDDPYQMGVTLQVYPFPLRKKYFGRRMFLPFNNYRETLKEYRLPMGSYLSWQGLARGLFDKFRERGGAFHLWGHSWEIEKYGMWRELEKFFKYASGDDEVEYLTNSEVVEKTKNQKPKTKN